MEIGLRVEPPLIKASLVSHSLLEAAYEGSLHGWNAVHCGASSITNQRYNRFDFSFALWVFSERAQASHGNDAIEGSAATVSVSMEEDVQSCMSVLFRLINDMDNEETAVYLTTHWKLINEFYEETSGWDFG